MICLFRKVSFWFNFPKDIFHRTRFLFILGLSLITQLSHAQLFKDSDSTSKEEGLFILPLLYYTPDTRFAAGAMGVYYFRTGDTLSLAGKNTRLSYIQMLADYTQNRQLDVWAAWNIFTNREDYLFKGDLRYRNFPDRFFGIGNNTPDENMERYTYDYFSIKLLGLKQIRKKAFIGLDYQFSSEYNFRFFDDKELARGTIPGYKGGISSALGFVFTNDTRDNVVNAWKGHLFEVSSYFNNRSLGSDFEYINLNITFNKYRMFAPGHVLAFNSVANLNTEGVPFLDMAKVGNDNILRGYPRNRYRDLNFTAAQVEYRYPVWGRFGGAVFTGIGEVFNTVDEIKFKLLKYSYGAGLRFAVNKKERLNIRVDYGWGRGEHGLYIALTEAF
jgi:hypothetical protein